jgi:exosortase B
MAQTLLGPSDQGGADRKPWLVVGAGLLVMYLPTLYDLYRTVWASDDQGHGPIVLALSIWLLWRKWPEFSRPDAESRPTLATGLTLVLLSGLMYALGRSQQIRLFELASLIPMLAGIVLVLRGQHRLKAIWFPLFFMFFMMPLPGALVDALTQPMKMGVSISAEAIMHLLGYPVARTGVILQIGPYQLLVADACAGLHTLFTLEALGLLYLNVVRTASVFRNVGLAILIVPISFGANVIRVIVLSLITYHLGDEAGQGFLHGFAGMVLFMSALTLIIFFDSILRFGGARLGVDRK